MTSHRKLTSLVNFKYFLLLFAIIFISACNKSQARFSYEISKEDRVWMTDFFRHIMLWEHAIYTLWGSKPLTLIVIEHYTDEEMSAYLKSLSEEEKKKAFFIENNTEENWAKWEKISSNFPLKRYLFFKSDTSDDPHATFIYFVDVLKTACIIQENYDLFREGFGFDFVPLEMVLDMPNKDSLFWKGLASKHNAHLWGILFGFGRTNSLAFQWKHFDHPESCNAFTDSLQHQFFETEWPPGKEVRISLNNFTIPAFASFDDPDPIVERYEKERERIRKIYQGKDFLDMTLQRLIR